MQVKPNKILSYLPADPNIAMDKSQVQGSSRTSEEGLLLDTFEQDDDAKIALSQDGVNPVRGSFDSSGDAHKFFGSPEIVSREGREMEAVLAGALRREQAADAATKLLPAEMEQRRLLVDEREVETRSKELVSGDSDLVNQRKMLTEELEVVREKVDPNPEPTRFAFQNISTREQIRSLQKSLEGGERSGMVGEQLQEALNVASAVTSENALLRSKVEDLLDQLQEALDVAFDVASENELLRSEVEDLQSNLSSSLESSSNLQR